MNKTLFCFSLLLAACSSTRSAAPKKGDTSFRVSGGVSQTELKATRTERFFGQDITVTEKFEGLPALLRVESNKVITKDAKTTAGVYLEFGTGDLDGLAQEHTSLGGVVRFYTDVKGKVRPFLEGRVGIRQSYIGSFDGLGLDSGAGLGVEFDMGRNFATHVMVGYDYATSDVNNTDSEFSGIGLTIGGSVRF